MKINKAAQESQRRMTKAKLAILTVLQEQNLTHDEDICVLGDLLHSLAVELLKATWKDVEGAKTPLVQDSLTGRFLVDKLPSEISDAGVWEQVQNCVEEHASDRRAVAGTGGWDGIGPINGQLLHYHWVEAR